MIHHISVFIDSDGVLADFDRKANEILGMSIAEAGKGRLWAAVERYDRHTPFFESLDKMPEADRLVEFVVSNFFNRFVLTATGYTPKDGAAQKKRWYAKHYPHLPVICVDKSPDKARLVHREMEKGYSSILIDDRSKSIDPWVAAGGIGILHTDVESTIQQLKTYM